MRFTPVSGCVAVVTLGNTGIRLTYPIVGVNEDGQALALKDDGELATVSTLVRRDRGLVEVRATMTPVTGYEAVYRNPDGTEFRAPVIGTDGIDTYILDGDGEIAPHGRPDASLVGVVPTDRPTG